MIFTLVIGLALAFVLGMVARQLKLSPLCKASPRCPVLLTQEVRVSWSQQAVWDL